MEITTPGFLVGEVAWLADGRSGRIVGGNFNADAGEWLWAIDGVGGPFRESDLFHFDPTAITEDRQEREEPAGDFVTQDELVRAVLNLRRMIEDSAGGVDLETVRDMVAGGVETAVVASNEYSDGIVANAAFAAATALSNAMVALTERFENAESALTTGLSQVDNRLSSLETEAEEASGLTLGVFFRVLGSFIASPVDWVLERGRDRILGEVQDGLNR